MKAGGANRSNVSLVSSALHSLAGWAGVARGGSRAFETLESRQLLSTVVWDGGGDGRDFHDPANWQGDAVPGASDDAVIPSDFSVSIFQDTTVRSLTSQSRVRVYQTLTLVERSEFQGGLDFSSGESGLAGSGDVVLHRNCQWFGGITLTGTGTVSVSPDAWLYLEGNAEVAKAIDNHGGLTWQSSGETSDLEALTVMNTITNFGSMQVNLGQGPFRIFASQGGLVHNLGEIQVMRGVRDSHSLEIGGAGSAINFRQDGTFTVDDEIVVDFKVGCRLENSGEFVVGSDASVTFRADEQRFGTGTRISGDGVVAFLGYDNTYFEGDSDLAGSEMYLAFDHVAFVQSSTLTISGAVTCTTAFVQSGDGWVEVAVSGVLNLSDEIDSLRLRNHGQVNAAHNGPNTLRGDVENFGTLRKSGFGLFTIDADFTGTGAIDVIAGNLVFENSPGTHSQVIDGWVTVQFGAALDAFGDGVTILTHGDLRGPGFVSFERMRIGAAVTLTGSNIHVTHAAISAGASLTLQGMMRLRSAQADPGAGSFVVAQGARVILADGDHQLAVDIDNSGTIVWTVGDIQADGVITNRPAGFLDANFSGTSTNAFFGTGLLANQGRVVKSGTGRLDVGFLDNTGEVEVNSGTINVFSLPTSEPGTLASGSWIVRNAGALVFPYTAPFTVLGFQAQVVLDGPSAYFPSLNSLATNNGQVTLIGRDFTFAPAGGVFHNHGSFTRSTGTGLSTTTIPVQFVNDEFLVSIESGTLILAGGGSNIGAFDIGSGATLEFGASFTHDTEDITGDGEVILSGGTHTILGACDWSMQRVRMGADASIAGGGDLTVHHTFDWNGGNISGSGLLVTAPDATVNYTTGNLDRPVQNAGVIQTQSGAWLTVHQSLSNLGTMAIDSGLSFAPGCVVTHGAGSSITGVGSLMLGPVVHTIAGSTTWSVPNVSVFPEMAITGPGDLTITGFFGWYGATRSNLTGTGRTILTASDAEFTMIGGVFDLQRPLSVERRWVFRDATLAGPADLYAYGGFQWTPETTVLRGTGVTVFGRPGTGATVDFQSSHHIQSDRNLVFNYAATISGGSLLGAGNIYFNAGLTWTSGTLGGSGHTTVTGATAISGGVCTGDRDITFNGPVNFSSGTLTGTGNLIFAAGLTWTGGTLSRNTFVNPTAIVSGGALEIRGGSHTLARRLVLQTMTSWTAGALIIDQSNGGYIENRGGARFDSYVSQNFQPTLAGFDNSGTLNLFGCSLGLFWFHNRGDVQLWSCSRLYVNQFDNDASGVVHIFDGGAALEISGPSTNDGQISINMDARLEFQTGASVTHGAGSAISGDGALILGPLNHTISGATTWSVPIVSVPAGTSISGPGDLTITGMFDWSGTTGGSLTGAGRTILAADGPDFAMGAGIFDLHRPLQIDRRWLFFDSTLTGPANLYINASFSWYSTGVQAGTGLTMFGQPGSNGSVSFTGSVQCDRNLVYNRRATISGGSLIGAGNFDFNAGLTWTSGTLGGTGVTIVSGSTSIANGICTANRDITFNGQVTISSGTLQGTGNLTFAGGFSWSGGTLGGSGLATIPVGQVLTYTGSSGLRRSLDNFGTINARAGMILYDGVALTNRPGGTFNADANSGIRGLTNSSYSQFVNQGVYNKNGGETFGFTDQVILTNDVGGVLNINAGIFEWVNSDQFGIEFFNNGRIDVDSGTMFRFTRGASHGAGSSITGGGTVDFNYGTHVISEQVLIEPSVVMTFTGAIVTLDQSRTFVHNVTLSAGTLQGAGDFLFAGGFNWSGGTLGSAQDGGALATIPAGQVLALSGGSGLRRSLDNFGTINYSNGLGIYEGSVLTNRPGATFNASRGISGSGSPYGQFVNEGVYNKNTSGTYGFAGSIILTNAANAVINVNVGSFEWTNADQFGIEFFNNGRIDVGPGATVSFTRGANHGAGSSITGGGTVDFNYGTHVISEQVLIEPSVVMTFTGAIVTLDQSRTFVHNVTLSAGTLQGTGNLTFAGGFSWSGGTLGGSGLAAIPAGQVLAYTGGNGLRRSLDNFGTMNARAGMILYDGVVLTNRPGGTFNADSSSGIRGLTNASYSQFVNQGVYNKNGGETFGFTDQVILTNAAGGVMSVNAGTLAWSTSATASNLGTLNVALGATASISSSIAQLSAGVLTGGFWNVAGTLSLPGGAAVSSIGPAAAVLIDGAAAIIIRAGSGSPLSGLASNAGTLALSNGAQWSFVSSGTFHNSGVFRKAGTGVVTVPAAITSNNPGTVEVTGGTLTFAGPVLQLSAGTLSGGIWTVLDGARLNLPAANITMNQATITLSGGGSLIQGLSGITTNTGTITLKDVDFPFSPADNTFANTGTLNTTGDVTIPSGIVFNNGGNSVHVLSGRLTILGGGTHTGDFHLAAGSSLVLSGIHTLVPGADVIGDGSITVVGGTFSTTGAVSVSGAAYFQGGVSTFSGSFACGAMDISSTAAVTLNTNGTSGPVSNAGVLVLGNHTLSVTGDYSQSATGVLRLDVLGFGANQFGRLNATGVVSLAGRLDVNLLTPYRQTGAVQLLAASSMIGSFSIISLRGPRIPPTMISYHPTSLMLTIPLLSHSKI